MTLKEQLEKIYQEVLEDNLEVREIETESIVPLKDIYKNAIKEE